MSNLETMADKRQAGFTLVELAVVMIIIGLLIGGVLKGQELIANAQITSTAGSVKGIDAATTTFRDTYASLPGDITNAAARLPNCNAAPCTNAGNGNSRVDSVAINAAQAGENLGFWSHLSAADLLTGVDSSQGLVWGGQLPSAPIAGGYFAAYSTGGVLGSNNGARAGHYLALNNNPAGAPNGTTLTALQAARLDRKLDDGAPNTGTVFTNDGGTPCNNGGIYDEPNGAATCDLYIRFQN